MREFLWVASLIGAGVGLLAILTTISFADSAPQEAAGFASALAFAGVPYVLARSWEELVGKPAPGEKRSLTRRADLPKKPTTPEPEEPDVYEIK